MKINQLFTFLICFICTISAAQENVRVEISGKIVVDRNDVEGVTVFNKSSQKGTVTDAEGRFTIAVTLNDRVAFSALQFQDFEVIITKKILDSKEMTVHLVEKVNTLDEVVILPYGLTGILNKDVKDVEIENANLDALYFGLDNLDKIEFAPDHLTEVNNVALEDSRLVYGLNMKDIVVLVMDKLFKAKNQEPYVPVYEKKTIMTVYTMEYLVDALKMKEDDIVEFIYYVEENNFDLALLEPEKELQFLNYVNLKKKDFLKLKYGKD